MKMVFEWGEEGKKLFIFQRKSYRSSFLAPGVEKKRCGWILTVKTVVTPSLSVVVVD
jgi:hypothetical protein